MVVNVTQRAADRGNFVGNSPSRNHLSPDHVRSVATKMDAHIMTNKSEEYRRHAQECLDAIPRLHTEEEREILLRIAQVWQGLAEEEQV
jgi:hypothetical protein